jgi:hypothetical protein
LSGQSSGVTTGRRAARQSALWHRRWTEAPTERGRRAAPFDWLPGQECCSDDLSLTGKYHEHFIRRDSEVWGCPAPAPRRWYRRHADYRRRVDVPDREQCHRPGIFDRARSDRRLAWHVSVPGASVCLSRRGCRLSDHSRERDGPAHNGRSQDREWSGTRHGCAWLSIRSFHSSCHLHNAERCVALFDSRR